MTTTAGLGTAARLARWSLGAWMEYQLQQASHRDGSYVYKVVAPGWRRDRTAPDLAAEIRQQLAFGLAQAAWQLSSPTDQEVLQVAAILLGYPYGPEVQLLADAIIIAGAPKGSQQRKGAEHRALMTGADLFGNKYFR